MPTEVSVADSTSLELLALSKAGDGEAFCQLVEPLEARLFRQAFLMCRDASRAEELAQETLVAAWTSIGRYDGSCQLFTWLYAIMMRRHRKQLRTHRRRSLLFNDLLARKSDEQSAPVESGIDDHPKPDEAYLDGERAGLLRDLVDHLPENHRQVVMLRFYADASLEDIAHLQHCSVGTVKSRLFYGIEKLRKMNLKDLR